MTTRYVYDKVITLAGAAGGGVVAILDKGTQLGISAQVDGTTYPSCTVSSGTSFLVLSITISGTVLSISSISWSGGGGQSLTLIGAVSNTSTRIEFWGLVNPAAQAGGTFTLVWSGSTRVCMEFTTWTGTNTTSVAAATGNVTSTNGGTNNIPSLAITTAVNDAAIAAYIDDSNFAPSCAPAQTLIYADTGGRVNGSNYSIATTTTTTLTADFTATSGPPTVLGFDLKHS